MTLEVERTVGSVFTCGAVEGCGDEVLVMRRMEEMRVVG